MQKKIVYKKYDKKKLEQLPLVTFPGRIVVVQGESEANRAVEYLMTQPILGFDTETRPAFQRGQNHLVALLQVSSAEVCFLFRLNFMGLPASLCRLLADDKIIKVGLAFRDDLKSLEKRHAFEVGTYVELQKMAEEFGIEDKSLQKLYANLFGEKISKSKRLSNWEADVLTDGQKQYAAIDAWSCIRLYEEFERMRQTGWRLVEEELVSNLSING